MKWNNEINIQLLRCYYTVANLEADLKGYKPLLHEKFIEKYPELDFLDRTKTR